MKLAINLRAYFKGKIGGLENVVRNVCGGIAADQQRQQQPLVADLGSGVGLGVAERGQSMGRAEASRAGAEDDDPLSHSWPPSSSDRRTSGCGGRSRDSVILIYLICS